MLIMDKEKTLHSSKTVFTQEDNANGPTRKSRKKSHD
jgi:hypothetical protein